MNNNNSFVSTIILCVVVTMLASCSVINDAPPPPADGKLHTSNTFKGAIAGGAIGGLAGAATNSGKNAGIGAVIGAVTGGLFGHFLDKRNQQVAMEMHEADVQVINNDRQLTLIMPSNINFADKSSELNSQYETMLTSVSEVLMEHPDTFLEVKGYTDNQGTAEENNQLGEQRALTVANYIELQGIEKKRLKIVSFGDSNPLASNDSESGRKDNRRVELQLYQKS